MSSDHSRWGRPLLFEPSIIPNTSYYDRNEPSYTGPWLSLTTCQSYCRCLPNSLFEYSIKDFCAFFRREEGLVPLCSICPCMQTMLPMLTFMLCSTISWSISSTMSTLASRRKYSIVFRPHLKLLLQSDGSRECLIMISKPLDPQQRWPVHDQEHF